MHFRTLAYKQEFVPGDPAALDPADREDSWQQGRSFRCQVEPITANQLVRAGRDSAEKQIRIYYRPFGVELDNSSRVKIAGKEWDVVYPEPVKSKLRTAYVDCKEAP